MAGDAVSGARLAVVSEKELELIEALSELWELPAELLPAHSDFSPVWEERADGR
jgi:hypothetical protein